MQKINYCRFLLVLIAYLLNIVPIGCIGGEPTAPNQPLDSEGTPPPPSELLVTYDSLAGISKISWGKLRVQGLNEFTIYRSQIYSNYFDQFNVKGELNSFEDSLFKNLMLPLDDQKFTYTMKSSIKTIEPDYRYIQSKNFSDSVTINVSCPAKFKILNSSKIYFDERIVFILTDEGILYKASNGGPLAVESKQVKSFFVDHGEYYYFTDFNNNLWKKGIRGYPRVPVRLYLQNIVDIKFGQNHTIFLDKEGNVWAFGDNQIGQIGDAYLSTRESPVLIMTDDVNISAYVNTNSSFFVKKDGTLWVTGKNGWGQLGDGTESDRNSPVKIMSDVSKVEEGYGFTLILKNDGSLWSTGQNNYGQLGDGTQTNRNVPGLIMTDISSIYASGTYSLALKKNGTLWGMGNSEFGQLGIVKREVLNPLLVDSNVVDLFTESSIERYFETPFTFRPILLKHGNGLFKFLGVNGGSFLSFGNFK